MFFFWSSESQSETGAKGAPDILACIYTPTLNGKHGKFTLLEPEVRMLLFALAVHRRKARP